MPGMSTCHPGELYIFTNEPCDLLPEYTVAQRLQTVAVLNCSQVVVLE